jgi:hypothetical protein
MKVELDQLVTRVTGLQPAPGIIIDLNRVPIVDDAERDGMVVECERG